MSVAKLSSFAASATPMRRVGDVVAAAAPSVALVPLAGTAQASPASQRLIRPDPSFVTHLIAMAEQYPQTRILRRAATADVQAAYRSVANQDEMAGWCTGARTRLTA